MNLNGLPFDQVLDALYVEEHKTTSKTSTSTLRTETKFLESKYSHTIVLAASVVILAFFVVCVGLGTFCIRQIYKNKRKASYARIAEVISIILLNKNQLQFLFIYYCKKNERNREMREMRQMNGRLSERILLDESIVNYDRSSGVYPERPLISLAPTTSTPREGQDNQLVPSAPNIPVAPSSSYILSKTIETTRK